MLKTERVVAAALAAAVVSGVSGGDARDAVQWRVEDGGNGHWYEYVGTPDIAGGIKLDSRVDSADLGLLVAAWGDAPRNDYPPSYCPLGLIP